MKNFTSLYEHECIKSPANKYYLKGLLKKSNLASLE